MSRSAAIDRLLLGVAIVTAVLVSQGCGTNVHLPAGSLPLAPKGATAKPAVGASASGLAAGSQTSPSGAASTQPASKTSPSPAGLAASPTSTPVKPRVDQGKAESVLVGASTGGKIELKTDSDVTYTLEIPADALLSDEVITVAPVTQVDGLPFSGGLLGAVELQPEGMRLVKPATLTIQLPAGVKASGLIGFAYQGTGEDFHLYPMSAEGDTITASLMHFSSYGGGQGTQADVQAQEGKTPTDAESQFEQNMAAAASKAPSAQAASLESRRIEVALRNFFEDHVGPDLKAAETDDQSLDAALDEYWEWRDEVEASKMEDDRFQKEFAQAAASLKKAIQNAFASASQKCSSDKNWKQGLEMIKLARSAALLEQAPNPGNFSAPGIDSLANITPQLDKCWNFTLDYDSTITYEGGDNSASMDIIAHVKAQVHMELKSDLTSFGGQGELNYVNFGVTWGGASSPMNSICNIETQTSGALLKVQPLILDLSKFKYKAGSQQIMAVLGPGSTAQSWSWNCAIDSNGGRIKTNMPFPVEGWSDGFRIVNEGRHVSAVQVVDPGKKIPAEPHSDYYVFNHFKPAAKPVIAIETGTGRGTTMGTEVTEKYAISIVHTPDGVDTSGFSASPTPVPSGPKTTDTSVLPAELKQIPAPPNFAVVAGSPTRTAPGGTFQSASVMWWGKESISDITAFYEQALEPDWDSKDENTAQYSFDMTYVSKSDSHRVLTLTGRSESGGVRILETVQEK